MAPAIRKLLRKLKSFFVVNATAERPINVRPVIASAFIISAPPLGNVRYVEIIGPRVKPIKPVNAKVDSSPTAELAVL